MSMRKANICIGQKQMLEVEEGTLTRQGKFKLCFCVKILLPRFCFFNVFQQHKNFGT